MRWPARVSMLLTCLGLLGCTTFSGVKPIYPDVGNPNYLSSVDSLQPTFRWEAVPDAESYDFIIYESIKTESFWEGSKRSVGREVYYREELQGTEHRIEEPLRPNSEYYWSVRIRRGPEVSRWSLYHYQLFLGTGYVSATNQPFGFKTPKAVE